MFCNYPIPIWFYLTALPILILFLFPRYLEAVISSRLLWIGGAFAFIAGMLLIPSANHLMGDGLQRLSDPEKVFMHTEALDVLAHRLVYLIVGSAIWSYRIVGIIAGIFYLNGIRLVTQFGTGATERAIIALAFLCTATIQFYFGYVECYGLLNVFTLYYIYFAWKSFSEDRLTVWPVVFFVLATASHLSGASLLPSLIYLYRNANRWASRIAPVLAILAGAAVFLYGEFWRSLVPILPSETSAYSLFSGDHLRDLLCVLILISPAFFLSFFSKRFDKPVVFSLIALAGTLLFALCFDPVLGAVRDWDVLSVFALPLAAVIALRAPRSSITVGILACLVVIRIVPWLYFNSELQTEFIKKNLESDMHYTDAFSDGERLDSWGLLLYVVGDLEGAEAAWLKRLQYRPDRLKTLSMLAPMQYTMGKYRAAYESYTKMMQINPSDPKPRFHAIYTLFRMNRLEEAVRLISSSSEEFRNNAGTQRLLAGLLAAIGQHEEAVALQSQFPVPDTDPYLPYMLSKSALAVGKVELARQLIGTAIALDSTNVEYRKLAEAIVQSIP